MPRSTYRARRQRVLRSQRLQFQTRLHGAVAL